jgi:uncharacterized membrane protein
MKQRHQSTDAAKLEQDHLGLERLIFFSDAVFAIAITLLALEIRLPAGQEIGSDEGLLTALLSIWPRYLSYVVSFLVIGMYWMAHHRMFRTIARYDRRLLFLNLLLLLCIAFVPFPTAILGEHNGPVATIFYAATMVVTGLVSARLWWYASGSGRRLLAASLAAAELRASRLRTLAPPAVFLLSIAIALWNEDAAMLSWMTLAPLLLVRPGQAENRQSKPAALT